MDRNILEMSLSSTSSKFGAGLPVASSDHEREKLDFIDPSAAFDTVEDPFRQTGLEFQALL